jgi:hypothetical protein
MTMGGRYRAKACLIVREVGDIDRKQRAGSSAICSGADETHDAMVRIDKCRFAMQVEVVTAAELVAARVDGLL